MAHDGYDTPEAAAMSTFPPQHVRVVASASDGRSAYVLLDTGSPGHPYHYGVNCQFGGGRWYEGISSNGPGWSITDEEGDLGTYSVWNDVGPGVDCVRVELDGNVIDAPVTEDVFLAVWFDRPSKVSPSIVAYRQHGEWKPYEGLQ